jgi:hypothetical protein
MVFSRICKVVSICIFALAFLGAFQLAEQQSVSTVIVYDSEFSEDMTRDVKDTTIYYAVLISTWIASGILSLFLYGIGEIVGREVILEIQNRQLDENQDKIIQLLSKNTPGD